MKSVFLILYFCLSGLFSPPPRQDYPPLPSELAFIALLGQDGPYTINLVNRETLESYEIYRSEVYIHSLSWSPQGDLLAITQGNRFVSQICILTVEGALQRCLSESPLWYTAPLLVRNTPLTWSPDGTKVYYATQDGEMRRLIEVDIQTGETLQTLYEMEESNEYVNITWTPDLRYILIGASSSGRVPTTLVNRETGETQIIEDIVAPYLDELGPHTETQICPGFSPQNHYLTSITYTDYVDGSYYGSRMIIFDPAGNLIHTIDSPDHLLYCPAWMSSDDSFYLFRRNNREEWMGIFTYSLSEPQFISYNFFRPWYSWGIVVAPGDYGYFAYIAFTVYSDYGGIVVIHNYAYMTLYLDQYFATYAPAWRPIQPQNGSTNH